jgi:hypothetical protein
MRSTFLVVIRLICSERTAEGNEGGGAFNRTEFDSQFETGFDGQDSNSIIRNHRFAFFCTALINSSRASSFKFISSYTFHINPLIFKVKYNKAQVQELG